MYRNRRDHARLQVHPADAVIKGVGEHRPPDPIDGNIERIMEAGFDGRTATARVALRSAPGHAGNSPGYGAPRDRRPECAGSGQAPTGDIGLMPGACAAGLTGIRVPHPTASQPDHNQHEAISKYRYLAYPGGRKVALISLKYWKNLIKSSSSCKE